MNEAHNYPIGAMASGSGTTIEALCHAIAAYHLPMELRTVIYDRPEAQVLQRVTAINKTYGWDIKPLLVDKDTYGKGPGEKKWHLTDEQSAVMTAEFSAADVVVVCMLGFRSKVRGELYRTYGSLPEHSCKEQAALINSHPGWLWLTKGLWGPDVHKKTKDSGIDKSAQTLHVATDEYDEGAIIAENEVALLPTYTEKDIEEAVQAKERIFIAPDTLRFVKKRVAYQSKISGS